MSQRYNDNSWDYKNLHILLENLAQDVGSRRKHCWVYTQNVAASSPWKLPQLYLMVQGRAHLDHCSHIVKVGVEATW